MRLVFNRFPNCLFLTYVHETDDRNYIWSLLTACSTVLLEKLPQTQVLATCPYPEPARSSPYPNITLLENTFQYYTPIYEWVSQVVSFPQVSPTKSL